MANPGLEACPVCKSELGGGSDYNPSQRTYFYTCHRCGKFICSWDAAINRFPHLSLSDGPRFSGAIRERFERVRFPPTQDYVLISDDEIELLLENSPAPFDVSTKARKFLAAMVRRTYVLGQEIRLASNFDLSLAYAGDLGEFNLLKEYCKDLGWIEVRGGSNFKVTPKGWEAFQQRPRIESAKCFVAMAFAEVMQKTFTEAIEPAVRDDCGFNCKRIDAKEYNGGVVDEIKAEIRESRFIVADVTQHRNGVYFEAGFADGLGIPVIWTCNDADAGNTHFDTQHLNQIRWKSHDDLRARLANRIRATIGKGPLKARDPIAMTAPV